MTLLRDGLIKNLVWTLPAFLLIRHFSKELLTDYRKLFSFHRGCWKYLALAVPLAVLVVGGALFRNHGLVLSSSFHPSKLIIALLVGISEESVFRGFLLNADMKRADTEKKQIPAYAVNMVLFLLIHFPIWLREGVFVSSITGFGFVTVMLLGLLFGWCLVQCKSIWPSVVLHSFYDLLIFLLV